MLGMKILSSRALSRNLVRHLSNITSLNANEIKIPVPWGYIAGKEWGNKDGKPILCLHGWNDNAATFDPLAPLLDSSHHYVAIDIPGHGLSSHYPVGMHYHFYDLVAHLKRIATHFGWQQFSILGHSMGGATGVWFGSAYPEMLDKLVLIDIYKQITLPLPWLPTETSTAVDMFLDVEKKLSKAAVVKSYDFGTLVQRWIDTTGGSLTPKSAEILMTRGARSQDGKGYVYTRDMRLALPSVATSTIDDHRKAITNFVSSMMIIKAMDFPNFEPEEENEEFRQIYAKQCRKFRYVEVPGYFSKFLVFAWSCRVLSLNLALGREESIAVLGLTTGTTRWPGFLH